MAQNKVKHRRLLASASSDFVLTMMRLAARESEVELFETLSDFCFTQAKQCVGGKKKPSLARGKLEKFTSGVRDQLLALFLVVSVVL